jgi:hypothetical protein
VNRTSFALLASLVVTSAFARSEAPEVTFVSPCECQGFHGKNRWITKTDLSPVPSDKSAIQSVTPSQMYAWEGLRDDAFAQDITRARQEGAKYMADAVVDIADADLMTHEEIGRARLRMQARQWLAGKHNRFQYADNKNGVQVNVGVQVVLPEADRLKLIERHEQAMLANAVNPVSTD